MVARSEVKVQEISGIADLATGSTKTTLGRQATPPGMVPGIAAGEISPPQTAANSKRTPDRPIDSVTGAGDSIAQEVFAKNRNPAAKGEARPQNGAAQEQQAQPPAAGESGGKDNGGHGRNGPPAIPGEAGGEDAGEEGKRGKESDHLGTDKFIRVIHSTCGGAGCLNCNKGFLRREKKEVVRTRKAQLAPQDSPEIIFLQESRAQRNLRRLPSIPLFVNVFERNREPEIEDAQSAQENIDRLLRERFTDKAIVQAVGCENTVVSDRRSVLAAEDESIPTQKKIGSELDRLLQLGLYADAQIVRDLGVAYTTIGSHRRKLIDQGLSVPRVSLRQALVLAGERDEIVSEKTGQREVGISQEQQQAGTLLGNMIQDRSITADMLAENLGLNGAVIEQFVHGQTELNLEDVYMAVLKNGLNPDSDVVSLRNRERVELLNKLQSGQNWLQTLAPEDVTSGMSLDYLRLARNHSITQLAGGMGRFPGNFNEYVWDKRAPQPANLNMLLENYDIDPQSKEGQLFHAKRAKINPQSIEEFATVSAGEQLVYIRELFGLTQTEMGKILNVPFSRIRDYELNLYGISDEAIKLLAKHLGIAKSDPEEKEHAIIRVMRRRAAKLSVDLTTEDYTEILNGPVLMDEHIQQALRTGTIDENYRQVIQYDQTFTVITELLSLHGISIEQLDTETHPTLTKMINHMKRRPGLVPFLHTLAQALQDLDPHYTVHHPITQYVLGVARQEKSGSEKESERLHAITDFRLSTMEENTPVLITSSSEDEGHRHDVSIDK